jgi:TfdA family taurine catabolism dioxygenase TauD
MSLSTFHRPEGKSVWMGKDLATSDEWQVQLPDETIAEIDASLRRLEGRNVNFETLSAEDIPLATFSYKFAALKEEIANGRGFVVLRGLPVERYSLPELQMIYWSFGRHFGTPTPQSFLGDLIGDIMDLTDEEPDRTRRRGYHSGGAQVMHTDATDIVSMLSLQMAKVGGESRLCSAHTVHNLMLDNCPGLLKQFYDGFQVRMPDSDAEAMGRPAFMGRKAAFSYKDGKVSCAIVRGFVDRGVNAGDFTLTPVELAALEAFEAFSNHPDLCLDYVLRPGDMQFFNNRTVLHGRKHFDDYPEKAKRRHLLRLWLTVPEWPRLDTDHEPYPYAAMQKWRENAPESTAPVAAAE